MTYMDVMLPFMQAVLTSKDAILTYKDAMLTYKDARRRLVYSDLRPTTHHKAFQDVTGGAIEGLRLIEKMVVVLPGQSTIRLRFGLVKCPSAAPVLIGAVRL